MTFKKKTSVLLVDATGKDNNVIQVPTKLLVNWKKYFISFNLLVFAFLIILGVFIYQKTSEQYQAKLERANRIRSMIDIKKARESFQSIDKSIFKINNFLQEKGIQQLKLENAGGESTDFEVTDINDVADYYKNKIQEIEKTLEKTPLGFPRKGVITSHFGMRNNPFGKDNSERHSGLDFRANMGDPVKATADGIIEFAGLRGGYGNCIIIKHQESGLKTLFGHLSKINVNNGQKIKSGDIIGLVGSTGRSTGPHLHYEIWDKEGRIDPQPYLNL